MIKIQKLCYVLLICIFYSCQNEKIDVIFENKIKETALKNGNIIKTIDYKFLNSRQISIYDYINEIKSTELNNIKDFKIKIDSLKKTNASSLLNIYRDALNTETNNIDRYFKILKKNNIDILIEKTFLSNIEYDGSIKKSDTIKYVISKEGILLSDLFKNIKDDLYIEPYLEEYVPMNYFK